MKKKLRTAILVIGLTFLSLSAEAQSGKNRVFGSATCAQNISCSLQYDSNAITQLAVQATSCVAQYFSMTSQDNFFLADRGFDDNNCLINDPQVKDSNNYTPRCCLFPAPNSRDVCNFVCDQIFTR